MIVHAQLTPSCLERVSLSLQSKFLWITRTDVNICTVNNGNAAATADRTRVLIANAEALYVLQEES